MQLRYLTAPALALALAACGGQKAANNNVAANTTAAAPVAPPAPATTANAAAPAAQGEWLTTASGLRYRKVGGAGIGPKPSPTDVVTLNYVGQLTDGTEFDSSRGTPVTFPLPQLIVGWQEGVPLMSVGDTYEFLVPPEIGYGPRGSGPIPPNATLYFRIELLGIGG